MEEFHAVRLLFHLNKPTNQFKCTEYINKQIVYITKQKYLEMKIESF